MSGTQGPDGSPDAEPGAHAHDRRYKVFAVVFAAAVLIFAAISISVVILTA